METQDQSVSSSSGSRKESSDAAQRLLDRYAEPIMAVCIREAIRGDKDCLKICVERILPALKDSGAGQVFLPPKAVVPDWLAEAIMKAEMAGESSPATGALEQEQTDPRQPIRPDALGPSTNGL